MRRQSVWFFSVWFFSVMFLAGLPSVVSATTIVGIWTEKQITIAADSKQTLKEGERIVGSRTGCKVYGVRNMVVALAGLAETEGISVVDAIRNSRELVRQGTAVKLPEASLVVAAESALVGVLRNRQATSDPTFNVALILAGTIDGKLQMFREEMAGMTIVREYSMPNVVRRIAYPESRGHNGTDRNRGVEVIGLKDAIIKFWTTHPDWSEGDDVHVAKRLVGIEVADPIDSKYVGEPISTVVINSNGIRWIDKGVCQ